MNRATRKLERAGLDDVKKDIPFFLKRLLLEHDTDTERMFSERGQKREILYVSCDGLAKNEALM